MSVAHQKSRRFVIDPAYSVDAFLPPRPAPATGFQWICGESEYSCHRLSELRKNVVTAKLKVGYPGKYREPSHQGFFRSEYPGGAGEFQAEGSVRLTLDGKEIPVVTRKNLRCFQAEAGTLLLELHSETLPIFQPRWKSQWQYAEAPGAQWTGVELFPDTGDGAPPHTKELPTLKLTPERSGNGRFDAGCELLAYVEIHSEAELRLFVGESRKEAENEDPQWFEQNPELQRIAPGVWRSAVPLAFRYLKINGDDQADVICHALFTPEIHRGAFYAPDGELNAIFQRSAYTLRLCIHHFLIDGVKRDRLPWCGDLRISLLASAFTFADGEAVRRTLEVLGRTGIRDAHVNGITDYSLWYVINHDTFQLYFADRPFLEREYPKIVAAMEVFGEQEDADGFLKPGQWLFIDWVDFNKRSTLQMLYRKALLSGAKLAERMNDAGHHKLWLDRAEKLRDAIRSAFLDPATGLFRDDRGNDRFHRHPNFLALSSGIAMPEDIPVIGAALAGDKLPPTGTPYMAAMETAALNEAGFRQEALEKLRALWGGMLHDGATTFYEAFDPDATPDERLMFYSRKFGLSHCHAWGAGPASLLPEIFFGIKPLEDGWRSFETSPFPRGQESDGVFLTVPTPFGNLELALEHGMLKVTAPPECRHRN